MSNTNNLPQATKEKVKNAKVSADWFIQGYACAVANLIRMHGCDTPAEELFRDGIGSLQACRGANVDPFDMEILEKYFK